MTSGYYSLPRAILSRNPNTVDCTVTRAVQGGTARYTYTATWHEEMSEAGGLLPASRPELVASKLSVNTEGCWTEPNECEMVTTKAVLVERKGKTLRQVERVLEHPATERLSAVVDEVLEGLHFEVKGRPRVFVVPVVRGARLREIEREEAERTMIKALERHHGKLRIVIDVNKCVV